MMIVEMLISPTQKKWQIEGLKQDITWLFFHGKCRVAYPKPHNKIFHVKMAIIALRYLAMYYLVWLGLKIHGVKIHGVKITYES